VKYEDFTQITRRVTLDEATDDGQTLYRRALELLKKADLNRKIRLTGVSGQELNGGAPQLGLFAEPEAPQRSNKLNQALDAIASKFGSKAVVTADHREDDPDDARDGFYREDKRATAKQAEAQRQRQGPRTESDES
jgi:DNA polymerase-4